MTFGHRLDALRFRYRRPSDEQIASWPIGTRLVQTAHGIVRVRDTGGSSQKPALVMVPDGPCVIEHFDALIRDLHDSFRVVCFDLPGFGFSYPRWGYNFGVPQTVDVLLAVLDALDIARATLSFSCVNGYYALATARISPERIERLVLCQTPAMPSMRAWVERNIPSLLRAPLIGQGVTALGARRLASKWFDMSLPRESPSKEELRRQSLEALGDGGCFCLASVVQGLADLEHDAVAGVTVPTTMVWGDKDWSHRTTDFEQFREHVPHAETVVFEGCGHFPNLERPKAFADLLRTHGRVHPG